MNEPSRLAALWGWARTCCSLLWVLQNVERRVFQGTECLERQLIWLHSSLKASPELLADVRGLFLDSNESSF